jgi:hypothetical protein
MVTASYCGTLLQLHRYTPKAQLDMSIILVAGFPQRQSGFDHNSGHTGFVVDKMGLGQVFFGYFGFPCQFSFHQLFDIH